jgi:hypothetical protein
MVFCSKPEDGEALCRAVRLKAVVGEALTVNLS